MKKSIRFYLTGSIQPVFFNQFIKDNADKLNVKGFVRKMQDGRMEIFIEGDTDSMTLMIPLCRKGSPHSVIRKVEEKEEKFQGFSDFKIIKF